MHFNPNSPAMRFLDTLWRFVALNVVFVLTCIPLVTIGPALAALMSTCFAYDDHEDIPLVRNYFKRFGREWKYGLFSWLIFIAVGLIIAFSVRFWVNIDPPLCYVVLVILFFFAAYLVIIIEWFYPVQVRFENKWHRLWAISLKIGWLQMGTTLALVAIDIIVVTLAYFLPPFRVLFLIFGFSWVAYAKSLILLPAFKRVEKPEENNQTYINAQGGGVA